jgi:predicted acyltransferase
VVRNAAAVIAALLLVPLLVEPGLALVSQANELHELAPVARWMPFAAARQALLLRMRPTDSSLGAVLGGLTFALATALVVALGWAVLRRRDA